MNRDLFLAQQNSVENLQAREQNIAIMTKLISAQSELCRAYNLQKKTRLQEKYIATKQRLLISPRVNKSVG